MRAKMPEIIVDTILSRNVNNPLLPSDAGPFFSMAPQYEEIKVFSKIEIKT